MTISDSGSKSTPPEGKSKPVFSTGRVLQTIGLVALVLASVFTLWNPYKLFTEDEAAQANQAAISDEQAATIGILVGHWKIDSGSVCENGIVEADVNEAIANQISIKLNALGYPVKLLSSNDLDLVNYRGPALVALFCGSCDEQTGNKSGFTIGTTLSASDLNTSNALAVCMGEIYQSSTKLDFSYEIISPNHAAYSIFEMVNPQTPVIYLEMGSLLYDQSVLIENSEKVANGIVNGILCFFDTLEGQP